MVLTTHCRSTNVLNYNQMVRNFTNFYHAEIGQVSSPKLKVPKESLEFNYHITYALKSPKLLVPKHAQPHYLKTQLRLAKTQSLSTSNWEHNL